MSIVSVARNVEPSKNFIGTVATVEGIERKTDKAQEHQYVKNKLVVDAGVPKAKLPNLRDARADSYVVVVRQVLLDSGFRCANRCAHLLRFLLARFRKAHQGGVGQIRLGLRAVSSQVVAWQA